MRRSEILDRVTRAWVARNPSRRTFGARRRIGNLRIDVWPIALDVFNAPDDEPPATRSVPNTFTSPAHPTRQPDAKLPV